MTIENSALFPYFCIMQIQRYPKNWAELRKIVLERDNFTCQHCGCKEGEPRTNEKGKAYCSVLAIAHLDHDPENHEVDPERLMSLCQPCHLKNDRENNKLLVNAALSKRRIRKESTDMTKPQMKTIMRMQQKEIERLKNSLFLLTSQCQVLHDHIVSNQTELLKIIEYNNDVVSKLSM